MLQLDVAAEDGHDAMSRLEAIHCPTLVVSGGRDGAYPPGVVRDLLEGLPHAEHIEYAKAGHFGPGATVARDVATFLARDGLTSAEGHGSEVPLALQRRAPR